MANNLWPEKFFVKNMAREDKAMLPVNAKMVRPFLLMILFLLVLVTLPAETFIDPMSDSNLVLPAGSGITWRWLIPPVTLEKPIKKHTIANIKFSVDPRGIPWIGLENRRLLNPVRQVTAVPSEPFQDFVFLDNGLMLLTTVRTIGFIANSGKEEFDGQGYPVMPFQPICDLPSYYSRVYGASGNCVFLVSEDAGTKKTSIYLLKPEAVSAGGKLELRNYRKIFETGDAVTAVAGDDTKAFIALGKLVVMLNIADSKLTVIPAQPHEEVKELAYRAGIGLFYAGASGVGFLGAKRAFRFIETSHARIALHQKSLVVLFPRNLGVLAFDNIDRLWNFDYQLSAAGE